MKIIILNNSRRHIIDKRRIFIIILFKFIIMGKVILDGIYFYINVGNSTILLSEMCMKEKFYFIHIVLYLQYSHYINP